MLTINAKLNKSVAIREFIHIVYVYCHLLSSDSDSDMTSLTQIFKLAKPPKTKCRNQIPNLFNLR